MADGPPPAPAGRGEIVPAGLDYAVSLEASDLVSIDESYDLWIDGQPSPPSANRYIPTVNPATEETLSRVAEGGADEVGCGGGGEGGPQAPTTKPGGGRPPRNAPSFCFGIARMVAGAVPGVGGAGNFGRGQAHQRVPRL